MCLAPSAPRPPPPPPMPAPPPPLAPVQKALAPPPRPPRARPQKVARAERTNTDEEVARRTGAKLTMGRKRGKRALKIKKRKY